VVFEAYKRVKANKGAAGVDEESIEEFEKDLKGNLYKIWNRMSSVRRMVVKEGWACRQCQIGLLRR
jgi:retron-type reverse transcriptase